MRRFSAEPVPAELIEAAVGEALTAPAPHHTRPVRFVWVRDPATRVRLLDRMKNQWRADLTGDGRSAESVERRVVRGDILYDAPELVDELMKVCGAFSQYIAEVFVENPSAPMMFMGEDIAGTNGPIFSPSFIRQKALPIWKRIIAPLHKNGIKFLYHSDGQAKEILPIIVNELGADGFNLIVDVVHRHDRRFVEDDAGAAREHAGVGGAEIDGEVVGEERKCSEQHASLLAVVPSVTSNLNRV